jgi:hypothetical protein
MPRVGSITTRRNATASRWHPNFTTDICRVLVGDIREVWFIRGGFIYEVATYNELDSWLAEILATWKVI